MKGETKVLVEGSGGFNPVHNAVEDCVTKVFEGGDAHVQVHTDELPGDGELAEGEGSLIVEMTDFNILLIAKTRSDFSFLFHLTIRVKGPLLKVCAAAKHLILVGNAV